MSIAPVEVFFQNIKRGNEAAVRKYLSDKHAQLSTNWTEPLCEAAKAGQAGVMRILLEHGLDPNKQGFYSSPLMYAVEIGHVACVRTLIEFGVDVNVRIRGETALIKIFNTHQGVPSVDKAKIITLLCEQGADPNTTINIQNTPLIAIAAGRGDAMMVAALIKAGADVKKLCDSGQSPACAAAANGHIAIIEQLVKAGVVIDLATREGQRVLKSANEKNQRHVVDYLISHGSLALKIIPDEFITAVKQADTRTVAQYIAEGGDVHVTVDGCYTALHIAAEKGFSNIVPLLLDAHANIDARTNLRITPLLLAAQHNHYEVVRLLLLGRASALACDLKGRNALHYAASGDGDANVVDSLLQTILQVNSFDANLKTPLMLAAAKNKFSVIRKLIARNATADMQDDHGRTALMYAVRANALQCATVLIEHQADASLTDCSGRTPLYYALLNNYDGLVRVLMDKAKAETNPGDNLIIAAHFGDDQKITTLATQGVDIDVCDDTKLTALMAAARTGNEGAVAVLIDHGADLTAKDVEGKTALDYAKENGNEKIEWLLQHPDEYKFFKAAEENDVGEIQKYIRSNKSLDIFNADGETALHIATRLDREKVALALIEAGANVNSFGPNKSTALSWAAQNNNLLIARTLFQKNVAVNSCNDGGKPALYYAAWLGCAEFCNELLDHDAKPDLAGDDGVTPLIIAAQHEHHKIVGHLLAKNADVGLEDSNGRNAFFHAAIKGNIAIAEQLVDAHSSVDCVDNKNDTPLIYLNKESVDPKMIAQLVKWGASLNAVNIEHKTALFYAVENSADNEDAKENAKFLIKSGADCNIAASDGRTPLMSAAQHGQSELVYALLRKGATVDTQDQQNNSALYYAASVNDVVSMEKLIGFGADVDLKNNGGQTALMAAAMAGKIDAVNLLLSDVNNANVTIKDDAGHDALYYARQQGNDDVINVLRDRSAENKVVPLAATARMFAPGEPNAAEAPVEAERVALN